MRLWIAYAFVAFAAATASAGENFLLGNLNDEDKRFLNEKFESLDKKIDLLAEKVSSMEKDSDLSFAAASKDSESDETLSAVDWRIRAEDHLRNNCPECAEHALQKARELEAGKVTAPPAPTYLQTGSATGVTTVKTYSAPVATTVSYPVMSSSSYYSSSPMMMSTAPRRGFFGRVFGRGRMMGSCSSGSCP